MGIQNLLPLLEKSTRPCHVSEFRGLTVAVDSYCWLHKGARSCALELAKGEDTDMYVNFCMKYVNMLLSYDIKPIMVFDGRYLPAKLKTEEKRRDSKKLARQQGVELLRLGQVNEALKFFKQCVDITPEMALKVIRECRKINVDCIVAPYESDAQLAFFNLKGIAQCVISEDSDLLLFGCKKVLYKMDLNGAGQLVEADKLHVSMKVRPDQYTLDKFRYMCILSGCDYIDSLPGIGLKKALKFISMTAEDNPETFLDKLPRYLNMRHLNVDSDYKENFMTADATFKYQTVFDPFQRKLVPLNPIDTKIEYCRNSGSIFGSAEAYQLALGNLDPLTMKKIDDWQPSTNFLNSHSIWSSNYTPRPLKSEKKSEPEAKAKKLKMLDEQEIEKANLEHDQQMKKELEFYKKLPVEPVSTEKEPSPDTSPVLETCSNNPFLKKKLSKFGLTTEPPEQKVVKSKFFISLNSEISENQTELDKLNEVLPTPEEQMDVALSPFFHEINKLDQSTAFLTPDTNSCVEDLSLHTPDEEIDIDNSDMCGNENVYNSEDSWSDTPVIECECILQISEEEIQFPVEVPTLTSVENILEKPNAKKRRLETQSTQNKKQKKQVTIQEMFKRMSSK